MNGGLLNVVQAENRSCFAIKAPALWTTLALVVNFLTISYKLTTYNRNSMLGDVLKMETAHLLTSHPPACRDVPAERSLLTQI